MNNPQDIPLGLDEGSELIAVLFAVGLWGITCVQTCVFCSSNSVQLPDQAFRLFYFIQSVLLA